MDCPKFMVMQTALVKLSGLQKKMSRHEHERDLLREGKWIGVTGRAEIEWFECKMSLVKLSTNKFK